MAVATKHTFPFALKIKHHNRCLRVGTTSPVVDEKAFPDMKGLVDKIHAKGLRAGWYVDDYRVPHTLFSRIRRRPSHTLQRASIPILARYLNDCLSYCLSISDHCSAAQCIPGDVRAWHAYGFDSLKIDGCSDQRGTQMWADLLNKTGTRVRLENCNNGPKPDRPISEGGCPYYHQYRTGGDIDNSFVRCVACSSASCTSLFCSGLTSHAARTQVRDLDEKRAASGGVCHHRASRARMLVRRFMRGCEHEHCNTRIEHIKLVVNIYPSDGFHACRAYPDMLMIGVQGQTPDESTTGGLGPWAGGFVQPTVTEQRSHFGLWCTLSAPLTLSLDFNNKSATDSVWDIITNKHAIAVNQVSSYGCHSRAVSPSAPSNIRHAPVLTLAPACTPSP